MMFFRRFFVVLNIGIGFLCVSQQAIACSCRKPSIEERFYKYDYVALIKVTDEQKIEKIIRAEQIVERELYVRTNFEPINIYKKSDHYLNNTYLESRIILPATLLEMVSDSCYKSLEVGSTYVVFLSRSRKVFNCSGSFEVVHNKEDDLEVEQTLHKLHELKYNPPKSSDFSNPFVPK